MPDRVAFAREEGGATILSLRLTPKGGRDSLDGPRILSDGRVVLSVRVRAVPENGAANAALVQLLKEALGVPVSIISIVSGASARLKTIRIDRPYAVLEAALRHACSAE